MSTRTFSTGLCPDCSCKLNYRSEKREVKRLKRQKKKRKDRSSPNESVEENIEAEPESVEEPSTSTSTVEVPEKEESLWRKGSYRILPCAYHISIVILHGDSGNKRPLLQDNPRLYISFCHLLSRWQSKSQYELQWRIIFKNERATGYVIPTKIFDFLYVCNG